MVTDAWAVLLAALAGGLLSIATTLIAQRYEGRRQAAVLAKEEEARRRTSELEALGEIRRCLGRWLEEGVLGRAATLFNVNPEPPDPDARSVHDPTEYHLFPETLHMFWLNERVRDKEVRRALDHFLVLCMGADHEGLTPVDSSGGRGQVLEALRESGLPPVVRDLVAEYVALQKTIGHRMRELG
jgi:hypothetical protein